ncbi:DUF2391 family protein, partial [Paraburkholderia sp. SIMBA_027]|uniref:DUF2391 family protein n=1 Tax=Paraburkholderia sp. SIMBA_027 TaxID=3085770 RepID=UPI00397D08EC
MAFAIGIVSSVASLLAVGVLKAGQRVYEIAGKIALQAVPGSIGALLGRSQLDGDESAKGDESDPVQDGPVDYSGEMFLMALGA